MYAQRSRARVSIVTVRWVVIVLAFHPRLMETNGKKHIAGIVGIIAVFISKLLKQTINAAKSGDRFCRKFYSDSIKQRLYEKSITTINATNDFGIHSPRTKRLLYKEGSELPARGRILSEGRWLPS